jgi:membrane fusion protein (multidrug efflux system)
MHSQDKFFDMKSTYNIIGAVAVVLFMAACGASAEGDKKGLHKKKAQLEA